MGSVRGKMRLRKCKPAVAAAVMTLVGCTGQGHLSLTTADTLMLLADGLERSHLEYHDELERADDDREDALIEAFIVRVTQQSDASGSAEDHAQAFRGAMRRVRDDRRSEWQRHAATLDNLAVLHDMARDLRRLGIESLSLDDEARRYLGALIERSRTESEPAANEGASP